jgi:hypothetical protein
MDRRRRRTACRRGIEQVRRLGVTTEVETAESVLGIGRSKSYEMAKSGQFPVRILRIGRGYFVPVPDLIKVVGVEP